MLTITEKALSKMKAFVQDHPNKNEAGGVLLGRAFEASDNLIVDEVTTPQPSDKRHRFRFFRTQKGHQKIIDGAWEKSGGIQNYLGEWHTHPEPIPTPSKIDIENWLSHIQNARFDGESLIFLIFGKDGFCAFEVRRDDLSIHNLLPNQNFSKNE
jgi:integrative and conjugative element protein (TIGR02256 family)